MTETELKVLRTLLPHIPRKVLNRCKGLAFDAVKERMQAAYGVSCESDTDDIPPGYRPDHFTRSWHETCNEEQ